MDDNIILFPKMQKRLEQEVEEKIKHENYTAALENIQVLREHGHVSYPLYIQTLICHIKLRQLTKAEILCEELMEKNDQHYIDYLDYYVMILYEAGKYQAVIDKIEEVEQTGQLLEEIKMKFKEIKRLAIQMNEWASMELVEEIRQAIQDNLPQKQYYLIQKWRQLYTKVPKLFYDILIEETIHPVIKSIIMLKLVDEGVTEEISIQKFTYEMNVIPKTSPKIELHPIYQKTVQQLEKVEQENPTLYELLREMYDQYCFVMYPFMYKESEIELIVGALHQIVQAHFDNEFEVEKTMIMEQIEVCCHLYQQIMLQ